LKAGHINRIHLRAGPAWDVLATIIDSCVHHTVSRACVLSGDNRGPRAQATRPFALLYGGNKDDDGYLILIHLVPATSRDLSTLCLARARAVGGRMVDHCE
jgi:hypothetical protein